MPDKRRGFSAPPDEARQTRRTLHCTCIVLEDEWERPHSFNQGWEAGNGGWRQTLSASSLLRQTKLQMIQRLRKSAANLLIQMFNSKMLFFEVFFLLVVSRLGWVNTLNRKESPQRGEKRLRRGSTGSEVGRSRRFHSTWWIKQTISRVGKRKSILQQPHGSFFGIR